MFAGEAEVAVLAVTVQNAFCVFAFCEVFDQQRHPAFHDSCIFFDGTDTP
jgi:hypothetical protein